MGRQQEFAHDIISNEQSSSSDYCPSVYNFLFRTPRPTFASVVGSNAIPKNAAAPSTKCCLSITKRCDPCTKPGWNPRKKRPISLFIPPAIPWKWPLKCSRIICASKRGYYNFDNRPENKALQDWRQTHNLPSFREKKRTTPEKNCHVDIALDQSTEFSKTDHQTLFGDII